MDELKNIERLLQYAKAHAQYIQAIHSGDDDAISDAALDVAILEDADFISHNMDRIDSVARRTGYSMQHLRRIAKDHGPGGTGKVRCEKRGAAWYFFIFDLDEMLATGELRGPHSSE